MGPCGTLSQCNSDQPVADGPVGPSAALGLVGPCGMFLQCDNDQPVADGLVDPYEMSLQIDINKVVTTDELANSVGKSPEEDNVTLCPLIDCLSRKKSDELPEIDMLNNDRDSQLTETEEFYSDQELATDESSCEEYEPWPN